jgi:hypothetical protein
MVSELDQMTQSLVDAAKPERILLFGSHESLVACPRKIPCDSCKFVSILLLVVELGTAVPSPLTKLAVTLA